jgi:hypothetical protein
VESFNGRLGDELLSSKTFETLVEAKYLLHRWRMFYNHRRIHSALGKRIPAALAAWCATAPAHRSQGHGPLRSTQPCNGWNDKSDPLTLPATEITDLVDPQD